MELAGKSAYFLLAGSSGLQGIDLNDPQRLQALSGGERTRLLLFRILGEDPDFLVLDEPTNHLDMGSVQQLEEELKRFKGTLLLISHDRSFLDNTVDTVFELEQGNITVYHGNYSSYRAEKKRREEERLHHYTIQKKNEERILAEIKQLRQWSAKAHRESTKKDNMGENKMGAKEYHRKKAKKIDSRIKSKIKRLESLLESSVRRPEREEKLELGFSQPSRHGKCILEARGLLKAFGDNLLFKKGGFYLKRGEKMGILGPNGCGKSTLLKCLAGLDSLNQGEVWISPSAKIAYLSQDSVNRRGELTPRQMLGELPGKGGDKGSLLLAALGFKQGKWDIPFEKLSLGERTRLRIALLILEGCDCLLLDEPTNHLDLQARESLEEALGAYEGALLLVSHDRYLLEKTCQRLLVFRDKELVTVEDPLNFLSGKTWHAPGANRQADREEEESLLLECRLAALLGEINLYRPGTPAYEKIDGEIARLMEQRKNKRR